MVSLSVVRASNAGLKDYGPGLVAVFGVGGTSGIGESSLKAFVANTLQPRAYIVGRNEQAAGRIISEAEQLNPDVKVSFIQCDVTLLKNVDTACATIKEQETSINLLFLTCGVISFAGREETAEHLDRKLALNFYARFRAVHDLLPLLVAGAQGSPSRRGLARVVSVLSAGRERPISDSDLELKEPGSYSFAAMNAHGMVMNDFACEELSRRHPELAFVHMFPGFVRTNQINSMDGTGSVFKWLLQAVSFLASPLSLAVGESGERTLYNATAREFGPKEGTSGVVDMAVGSDGTKGSGAYLLNWDGSVVGKQEVLGPMREKGFGPKIWEHALEVFARVEGMDKD